MNITVCDKCGKENDALGQDLKFTDFKGNKRVALLSIIDWTTTDGFCPINTHRIYFCRACFLSVWEEAT